MAVSGEVYEQDSGVKLHPYLIALARWCVSCLWSTATAMLYRLLANPLPQITAPKSRPAGKEHLHPEPRVECVVLHQPAAPRVDVVFVHGLYGSLGNTWRQGEWRSKYKIEPNKVPLKRPNSIPSCGCEQTNKHTNENYKDKIDMKVKEENILNFNDKEITFTNIDEYYKKRITDDEVFITEKFYKEVDQCEVIDNYDTQAKFVRDLFNMDNIKVENLKMENVKVEKNNDNCRCRAEERRCEVGCGCVCDACYSSCWPRDWIKEDYPHARVISINYTSDPHLWRPLWVKQCKRLHLHERAEQMISQLIALGVGQRPIVWVGHSKGGLFIKQIYCEAYEAYMKVHGNNNIEDNEDRDTRQNCDEYDKDNARNHETDGNTDNNEQNIVKSGQIIDNNEQNTVESGQIIDNNEQNIVKSGQIIDNNGQNTVKSGQIIDNNEQNIVRSGQIIDNNGQNTVKSGQIKSIEQNIIKSEQMMDYNEEKFINNNQMIDINQGECTIETNLRLYTGNIYEQFNDENIEHHNNDSRINDCEDDLELNRNSIYDSSVGESNCDLEEDDVGNTTESSNEEEELTRRSLLWSQSSGFMFYSVPHRGSPLADIKTPFTARSVELLEMGQDCSLVTQLHARWLSAASRCPPPVRSLVETTRTLMAVLWLRIVSPDSADAGIGALCGVSVDHREICKPSSRRCILYTELKALIHAALTKCQDS